MINDILIERNIVYGTTKDEFLTADLYKPSTDNSLPVLILIHGGGFESGSKEKYLEWGPFFAENGFLAMAINYRLSSPKDPSWPEVINNVRDAVNWLVKNANELNIEPLKMGLVGDSAGAHLAALYSLMNPVNASYKIRSAVCVYGLYDLYNNREYFENDLNKVLEKFIGKPFNNTREQYKLASPTYYIKRAVENPAFDTEFLLIWGEKDQLVPPKQSIQFIESLKKANVPVEHLSIKDMGHLWFNITEGLQGGTLQDYPNEIVSKKIIEFLNKRLKIDSFGYSSKRLVNNLKKFK